MQIDRRENFTISLPSQTKPESAQLVVAQIQCSPIKTASRKYVHVLYHPNKLFIYKEHLL